MSENQQQVDTPNQNTFMDLSSRVNRKFSIVTLSLLLLIIILLSGLWLKMRFRAIRAERNLAHAQMLLQRQNALEQIQKSLLRNPVGVSIERKNLERKKVSLDGKDIDALLLPATIARWIGFRKGDVIIVEVPTPTSNQTATKPTPNK